MSFLNEIFGSSIVVHLFQFQCCIPFPIPKRCQREIKIDMNILSIRYRYAPTKIHQSQSLCASLFLILNIETLTASALAFAIGIVKGELTAHIGNFIIHDCSHDTKEGHGFNKDFDTVRFHLFVMLVIMAFELVVESVG